MSSDPATAPDRRLDFTIVVHQNKYLPTGERRLHAILTVAAQLPGRPAGQRLPVGGEAAEVIIVDCSSSMAVPEKIGAAIAAARLAIDTLPEGMRFAVVAGTHTAQLVYPSTNELRRATDQTRREAKRAVSQLLANGGTAMSTWLALARDLLAAHPGAVRHAILLTDGQNGESSAILDRVLRSCQEVFTCDARGIGDDWRPTELLWIADRLHGTADAVPDLADLPAGFERLVRAALRKVVPQLRLRITTGRFARLHTLEQVFPHQSDLTEPATRRAEQTHEVATGAWGEEVRDYHLCLELDDQHRPRGEDLRAARIDLVVGSGPSARPVPVLAHWTPDRKLSSRIDPIYAGYSGQQQASQVLLEGLQAYERGQVQQAEHLLGEAARLAAEKGNDEVLERLRSMVVIDDAAAGIVRLRDDVSPSILHSVHMVSRFARLVSGPPGSPYTREATGPDQTCVCGRIAPGSARYCEHCGRGLRPPPARVPA